MSRLILALTASLLLLLASNAHVNNSRGQSAANANVQPGASPEQTELDEASRITLRVVDLYGQGRYDEALPLAQRALDIRQKYLRPGDPLLLTSQFNLAEIEFAKNKYDDAMTIYKRLQAAYEQNAAADISRLAQVLDRLAFLYYLKGDFDRTESSYRRALEVTERVYGEASAEAAAAAYQLAHFYRLRGKNRDAETFFNRAFEIQAKLLGTESPQFKKTVNDYLCLLYQNAQLERANELDRRVMEMVSANTSGGVSGGVLNGRAISLPRPDYPASARSRHVGGIVVIKVVIDEAGRVISAEDMCGGFEPLINASKQSALNARFTPTLLSGQPVKVTGTIVYIFVAR